MVRLGQPFWLELGVPPDASAASGADAAAQDDVRMCARLQCQKSTPASFEIWEEAPGQLLLQCNWEARDGPARRSHIIGQELSVMLQVQTSS